MPLPVIIKLMTVFFLILFFLLILISSCSFASTTGIAAVACLFSFLLLIVLLVTKRAHRLPRYTTITLCIVLLSFSLSVFINAIDLLQGYESLFLWSSYLLVYAVSTQIHIPEKKLFWAFLIFVFVCIGLFIVKSIFPLALPFISASDKQFLMPSTGMHNHLGDVIGLGLISALFITSSSRIISVLRLIFFPFIILSFTKSAILSLLVVLTIAGIWVKERRGNVLYTAFILFYIGVASIILFSQEFSHVSFVSPVQKYLQEGFNLYPKPLLSQRPVYMGEALSFLRTSPFEYAGFGVGPGNYLYASSKMAKATHLQVSDPHNIFLTSFVEGGILSLLWITLFFLLVLYYGVTYKKHTVFLFLYLLLLFQTDYLHTIPAFMFLFFFLSGQIVQNPHRDNRNSHLIDVGLWGFLFISAVFLRTKSYVTQTQYINQQKILIQSVEKGNLIGIERSADTLSSITPYKEALLIQLSSIYEAFGKKDKATFYLDRLLTFQPHVYVSEIEHICKLKKELKQDTAQYMRTRMTDLQKAPLSDEEKMIVKTACTK